MHIVIFGVPKQRLDDALIVAGTQHVYYHLQCTGYKVSYRNSMRKW